LSITSVITSNDQTGGTSDNLLNSPVAPGGTRNFFVLMSDIGATSNGLAITLSDDTSLIGGVSGGIVDGLVITVDVFNGPGITIAVD